MSSNQSSPSSNFQELETHPFTSLLRGLEMALMQDSLFGPFRQTMVDEHKSDSIIRSGFIDLGRSGDGVIFNETEDDLSELASIYGRQAEELSSFDTEDAFMHLAFLGLVSAQIREESKNKALMTPEVIRLVRTEIKLWCKASEISQSLILSALKLWKKSPDQTFPTLEGIVNDHLQRACFCLRSLSFTDQKAFITHFFIEFGKAPSCKQTFACAEYYRIQRTWPSPHQLDEMIERIEHLANDLQFEQKERDATPTLNLHLLKPQPADEKSEAICALCQDPIKPKDLCYKLPPCNHLFHAQSEQCLGGCTITTWLEKNDKCPVCRQKIEIGL